MTNKHNLLRKLVYSGARDKNVIISDIVLDRITYELSIIEKLGFTDYFILFSRIIEICNELNLLRSFGRGSAANSIVNYCLDITKINPIDENLIFERFLSPLQKQLPDIDIDIPKGHQKKLLELLKQKHPEYNSYFIAFSPQRDTDYEDVVYKNTIYKKHPCGIIITPNQLTNSTFFYEEQQFYLATNRLNDPIYETKFDILELEYLNRLQLIVNEIGAEYHPYKLPLNDKKVFNFFSTENLDNVFQFNSSSLKQIFTQFKPNSIHDLSIINAMFRPGILDYIPIIIRNKFNIEERFCLNDIRVSEILKETYGFLIYQETFLHLSKEIAGISLAEADVWRRKIMRDKSNTEIIAFSSVFVNGCRKNSSLNEVEIASLTNLITGMLRLTFQKAHSLSYSIVGYWGAFYKTHFRTHFDKVFNNELKFQSFELY
jgi:DNA polymerase-3 subunit alpha